MAFNYKSVLILLLVLFVSGFGSARKMKVKKTSLTFYMHDYRTGGNMTAVPVAGVNGSKSTILGFSEVLVIDDKITEGIESGSAEIGRAQGLYVNSAMNSIDLHLLLSVVFTNEKYNGSTLEIQGADRVYLKQREVSVVAGTGFFRYGRGCAILETAFLDLPNLNAVVKFQVTVLHYY